VTGGNGCSARLGGGGEIDSGGLGRGSASSVGGINNKVVKPKTKYDNDTFVREMEGRIGNEGKEAEDEIGDAGRTAPSGKPGRE
jgi:hypothetical protein